MGLAGIDDAFELGVGQQAVRDEVRRQVRPIGRLGRRDRGHRRRLHELGGMGLRAGNTDRLQSVFFIERIREAGALPRRPVHGLVGEFDALRFGDRGGSQTRCRARRIATDGSRCRKTGGRHHDRLRCGRQPRRNMLADPGEQRRHIGRDAR